MNRGQRTVAASGALASLCYFALVAPFLIGCPMPGAVGSPDTTSIPTGIPAGTYRGQVDLTVEVTADGELLSTESVRDELVIIIDTNGRLVNFSTGQPVKVGDRVESAVGATRIVGTTKSITASGNTITERYDVRVEDSGLIMTGEGVDQYIFEDGRFDVIFGFTVGNDPVADGFRGIMTFRAIGSAD